MQRRFGRPGEHVAIRGEPRPVTRAVPGAFSFIPANQATHVGAGCGADDQLSMLVAGNSHPLTVYYQNPAFSFSHRFNTGILGTQEPIFKQIVGIVDVLL